MAIPASLSAPWFPWMPACAGMTLFLCLWMWAPITQAAEIPQDGPGATISSAIKRTGLPIPRFASLRGEEVNMRAGPGFRYPIAWVFRRKGLPVEITAEFDTWRRIRDITGAEGWVHQSNLSGKQRNFIIQGTEPQPVYRDNDEKATHRAEAEPGVQGVLLKCRGDWCKVSIDGVKGWMKKASLWGVYDAEKVD